MAGAIILDGGLDEIEGRAAFDAFVQPVETGQLLEVPGHRQGRELVPPQEPLDHRCWPRPG